MRNCVSVPDRASGQLGQWRREAWCRPQLMNPLTAHSKELYDFLNTGQCDHDDILGND